MLGAAADRLGSAVRTEALRRRGVEVGPASRFLGGPIVTVAPGSRIGLGARFLGISRSRSTALGVSHPIILRTLRAGARIDIGDDVGMSGGTICAALDVSIGDGCLLGANAVITDTDFHPIRHPARRYAALPVPREWDRVIVGRNVFIGTGAIVLRGSWIGDDAVVGAGAVVRGRVEPGAVVAGEPPRTLEPAPEHARPAG